MMNRGILLASLLLVSPAPNAQGPRPFPDSLFGVKLGGVHSFGATETEVGTLPVKEFKGMEQAFGYGVHYYFKPMQANPTFKYVEKRKKLDDKYFTTSFRLYLLPVFPKNVFQLKELLPKAIKWEVILIEWSNSEKDGSSAYYSATDFCKTFQVDLGRKPEILDFYDTKTFSCTFKERERELKINSLGNSVYLALAYTKSVSEKKDSAAEAVYRKLRMNAIRPY